MNSLLGTAAYGPLGFMGYTGSMGANESLAETTWNLITSGSMRSELEKQGNTLVRQRREIDSLRGAGANIVAAEAGWVRAYSNFVKAREKYNEIVHMGQTYIPGFSAKPFDRIPGLSGMSGIPLALAAVGVIALLLALAEFVNALKGQTKDNEGLIQNARKALEAVTRIPEHIGEGLKRAGEGAHEAAKGFKTTSETMIQLAFAAALGYGIYWLMKNRRGGRSVPALTSSAAPEAAFKTVEAKVLA
jgi:hypothetical protein